MTVFTNCCSSGLPETMNATATTISTPNHHVDFVVTYDGRAWRSTGQALDSVSFTLSVQCTGTTSGQLQATITTSSGSYTGYNSLNCNPQSYLINVPEFNGSLYVVVGAPTGSGSGQSGGSGSRAGSGSGSVAASSGSKGSGSQSKSGSVSNASSTNGSSSKKSSGSSNSKSQSQGSSGSKSSSKKSSSSSCTCSLTAITPDQDLVCTGCNVTFTASGKCLDSVQWQAAGATPSSGTGASFSTNWSTTGDKTVTATCPGGSAVTSTVKIVAIEKIIVADSNPENEGPVQLKLGLSLQLQARRTPAPADGPWPGDNPHWEIIQTPSDFNFGKLLPNYGGTTLFIPDGVGTWKVRATCCNSVDEIEIDAVAGCDSITGVTADQCYETTDSGSLSAVTPMNLVGKKGTGANDQLTLTITLKDGADPAKLSWVGATQDGTNPRKVTVRYDEVDCREILVWPLWANVVVRIEGDLSPDNDAAALHPDHKWPATVGGGTSLGVRDVWTTPTMTYKHVIGLMEATATLSPPGVGDILPKSKLDFVRYITGILWQNGGHYANDQWLEGPYIHPVDSNDTSVDESLDLDPSGNDKLFDTDGPGFKQLPDGRTGELYANFTQYVTMSVCSGDNKHKELCSNEAVWSYNARIDYDKATNNVDANSLLTSHIDIPSTPFYQKR